MTNKAKETLKKKSVSLQTKLDWQTSQNETPTFTVIFLMQRTLMEPTERFVRSDE